MAVWLYHDISSNMEIFNLCSTEALKSSVRIDYTTSPVCFAVFIRSTIVVLIGEDTDKAKDRTPHLLMDRWRLSGLYVSRSVLMWMRRSPAS